MKDLKFYTKPKQNITYKLEKATTKKMAALGLSLVLATTSLSGCSKTNNENYSIQTTVEALNQKDGLTYVDEYLMISDIEKLDKEYQEAYAKKDKNKCNELLNKISSLILKALVAEGFDYNFADINDFEVLGTILHDIDPDSGKTSYTEYGFHYNYDEENKNYEAPTGIARQLCVIARAGEQNQLVIDKEETSFPDLLWAPAAYNICVEALKTNLKYDNKEHINKHGSEKGYTYNGNFKLKVNRKKSRSIKNFKKQLKDNKTQELINYKNIKMKTYNNAQRRR